MKKSITKIMITVLSCSMTLALAAPAYADDAEVSMYADGFVTEGSMDEHLIEEKSEVISEAEDYVPESDEENEQIELTVKSTIVTADKLI